MPQKIVNERGRDRLLIYVSVRCKDYPNGRIQLRKRFDDVTLGSNKANLIERDLLREAEKIKAQREVEGIHWEKLLGLYELHAREKLVNGEWVQGRQTLDNSISALHKWTPHWYRELANRIGAMDVTKLFHHMKEQKVSDVTIGKMRGDLRKVFEFGILFDHVRGMKQSPTVGVTIKSRRRMRTEILREDEIKKLLTFARSYEPSWYFIWAFAVYTGCRNGELYALKWSDIDFQDQMITVQRSFNKKTKEEKCTKTGEWRHISICNPLWEIVLELKNIHDHDLQRGACRYPGYVLPRPGLWQNGEQARKLRLFCEEIGITPVCFHTLRACFATELLKRGVDIPSVMRVGGWTSVKTMMHYVRLSGVDDKGITDPLDYRSNEPLETNKALMNAVGEKFAINGVRDAVVIPLHSRSLLKR
ncbi:MAG: tyrosine-type recombinase/integrase [Bacteriovoracia bacterium]